MTVELEQTTTPSDSTWSNSSGDGDDMSEDWRNAYLKSALENSNSGEFELTGDELDSLDELDAAQQEWDESIRQLQMLFVLTLIPVGGKFLGRRFAHYCK